MKKLNSQLNQNMAMVPKPLFTCMSGAATALTMVWRIFPWVMVSAMAPPRPIINATKPMDWQPLAKDSAISVGDFRYRSPHTVEAINSTATCSG